MKNKKQLLTWGLPALGVAAVITLVAWKEGPRRAGTPDQSNNDTVPANRQPATVNSNDRDFDKEIRAIGAVREKLKDVNWDAVTKSVERAREQFDAADVQHQVEEALKNVDMAKIKVDIDQAMKNVDFEKIQRQIDASMKQIDFDKLQQEINGSMDKEDFKELREDIQEAVRESLAAVNKEDIRKELDAVKREMKDIDWEKELADVKKINTEEIRREIEQSKDAFDKAMKELKDEKGSWKHDLNDAWQELDKAAAELKGYQEMIYDMEAAGLLTTKTDYEIRYNNGTLTTNGKEQSKATADKYRKYFSHDKTTIRKEQGKMDVDVD